MEGGEGGGGEEEEEEEEDSRDAEKKGVEEAKIKKTNTAAMRVPFSFFFALLLGVVRRSAQLFAGVTCSQRVEWRPFFFLLHAVFVFFCCGLFSAVFAWSSPSFFY